MAFLPIPLVIGLELRMTYYGEKIENTFYVQATGGDVTPLQVQTAAYVLCEWASSTFLTDLSSQLLIREVYARDLGVAEAYQWTETPPPGTVGTGSAVGVPGNVNVAVQRISELTGRSRRGRIFLTGFSQNRQLGNTIAQSIVDDKVTALNELNAAFLAEDLIPCIVSRVPSGGLTPHGSSIAMLRWIAADNNIDSQRRRLAGRGE